MKMGFRTFRQGAGELAMVDVIGLAVIKASRVRREPPGEVVSRGPSGAEWRCRRVAYNPQECAQDASKDR